MFTVELDGLNLIEECKGTSTVTVK